MERDEIKKRLEEILPKKPKKFYTSRKKDNTILFHIIPREEINIGDLKEKIKDVLKEGNMELNVEKIFQKSSIQNGIDIYHLKNNLMSEIDRVFEMRHKRGFI